MMVESLVQIYYICLYPDVSFVNGSFRKLGFLLACVWQTSEHSGMAPRWRPLHRAAVHGDVKELDRARAAPSFEVKAPAPPSSNATISANLRTLTLSPSLISYCITSPPLNCVCLPSLSTSLFLGLKIDAVDKTGNTALHKAVINGHAQFTELLVRYGT